VVGEGGDPESGEADGEEQPQNRGIGSVDMNSELDALRRENAALRAAGEFRGAKRGRGRGRGGR
jgi:hypothetical protein